MSSSGPRQKRFGFSLLRTLRHLCFAFLLLVSGLAAPAEAQILGGINTPAANGTVGQPFTISGWAVFGGDQPGTGIDAVDVWGCSGVGCTPVYWGWATYGLSRPDVGDVSVAVDI